MGLEVNPNLYPSGTGYRFIERDGSRHTSTGWRQLTKVIVAYRERNGMEPGSPWEEIMTQACAGNPGICFNNEPRTPAQPQPPGYASTIFQKISSWLADWVQKVRRKEVRWVDKAEASRRAAICAKCPRQTGIPTVCGACISQIQGFRRAILQGQAPVNQGLNACSTLGEDTQTTVHLVMDPVNVDGQPDGCWRRTV